MKLAYITAHAPFGRGETFVVEEMLAMAEMDVDLVVLPRNPPREVFHDFGSQLMDRTIWLPLIDLQILLNFLKIAATKPRVWIAIGKILRQSRTLGILVKNLAVFPKAIFAASILRQAGVEHIHVHWGSTTATMAWVISELTGIPWSMTLHRWDIAENNMLELKVKSAAFVRCISEDGRHEVLDLVGQKYSEKIKVVHMGVRLPEAQPSQLSRSMSDFVILCPANFVPKKGHRFLVEACALLIDRGIRNIRCLLTADGPTQDEIKTLVNQLGLTHMICFVGRIPREKLLQIYEKGEVNLVVLPSIVTPNGEKEGIPVALMEAMAYGIPVISTNTGGIPELLKDGAGVMVQPASPEALAEAISQLINNEDLRADLAQRGRERVAADFDLYKNAKTLLKLMANHRADRP